MIWRKLGRVFCADGQLPWMVSHASVPVALNIGGDSFRVYFSVRDRSSRSQLAWVELDINEPDRITAISEEPLLVPGPPGTFDDSGVILSWITPVGEELYGYTVGWNLGVTVPFRNSIGLAISQDGGLSFEKRGVGAIMDRNMDDPYFVASSCVLRENDLWRMWYLSCLGWTFEGDKPTHHYHLKYAESADGIEWRRTNRVSVDFKDAGEYAISRPSVIVEDGIHKMWYSYRGEAYRIGYAESEDGVEFVRKDEEAGIDVSPRGWDSEMMEYPYVFDHDGKRFMLYNGNGYGKSGVGLAVLESA